MLSALQGVVGEVMVVDTGSVDGTVSIVKSLGIEVHSFPWVDDFSKTRNYALSLAKNDWIFCVDSDEILYSSHRDCVRTAAALFEDSNLTHICAANEGYGRQGAQLPYCHTNGE